LKGIALKNQPIYLTTSHEPYAFVEYLKRTNPSLSALKGGFCFDPLANYLSKGTKIGDNIEALAAIFEAASDAKQWNVVHVGGHHFHEAGASVVQELAFTLASLVEYWHKLTNYEVSLGALATRTEVSLSVGTHYFVEIAKLRAMRLLLNRVGEGFNVPTQNVGIHAQTSAYTFSEADTDTNLLRHTTEAMSTVIGGADSLSIAPHQSQPLGFAKRIARNISILLREESYLDRVADAAAGSYYIENLTDTLAQKAWELFQEVEAQGGLIFAFEKDFLQKQIAENQAKHAALWQEKKWVMVGHNKYTKGEVAAAKTTETQPRTPRLILPHTLPSL
jgi:methylmalonyl-CoA mutase